MDKRSALLMGIFCALVAGPSKAAAQAEPGQTPPSYESPMKEQCDQELARDSKWRAQLRAQFEAEDVYDWHARESRQFVTNKQHVVGAYAALLLIVIGFVVSLFIRQRKLMAEIARLRGDVERAAKE
jgi:hypothetical protein